MRMQSKLTISYVILGCLTCAIMAIALNLLVRGEFEKDALHDSFETYRTELAAFVGRYGSLDKGLAQEPFDAFVRRLHAGERLGRAWAGPAYRFLGLDSNGVVVLPAGGYAVGDTAPEAVLHEARTIEVDGRVAAYASTVADQLRPVDEDEHLASVNSALLWAGLAALLSAALIGLAMAVGLTAPLRGLARAVARTRDLPDEPFRVESSADGEVGELARAFNNLNAGLAQACIDVEELSTRDPLTGLFNRRYFEEQAELFYESCLRYEQPMSIMMGDLDKFRLINETFTHEVGDLVLEQVARLITENTRKSDVVARYGGEEFTVLFSHTTRDKAAFACENIRRAVESFDWSQYHPDLRVTMSIGLTDNRDKNSTAAMLTGADEKLLEAKGGGRNRVAGAE